MMIRKIPKKESYVRYLRHTGRDSRESIGQPTGLLDAEGDELCTGDFVKLDSRWDDESGPIFWNREQKCFGVFYGCWYGDKDLFNPDCFGKFTRIPQDNGMRMLIHKISKNECRDAHVLSLVI